MTPTVHPAIPTLVPALLAIQERLGHVPEIELELLAAQAGVPLYRLEELTTFFPAFRRLEPGQQSPPTVSVHVCTNMSCRLNGAVNVLDAATQAARAHGARVEVKAVTCLGRCDRGPAALVSWGGEKGYHDHLYCRLGRPADAELGLPAGPDVAGVIEGVLAKKPPAHDSDAKRPDTHGRPPWQIDVYRGGGHDYRAVRAFLEAERGVAPEEGETSLIADELLRRLEQAALFGMGGAAATTFKKWKDVREAGAKRQQREPDKKGITYVVCNGDESEPGTFKDRELLLHAPHLVVEGMLLAGLTLAADGGTAKGYVYVRHEYHEQIDACRKAIDEARRAVPEALARCELEVYVSPGAYICGEESALIEAIEGKRAQPRNQPPSIKSNGLDDRPTLVNNVETFAWVPALALHKSGWWQQKPLRFFSISGDVKNPGAFEVPFTQTTLGDLIALAGGLRGTQTLQAVATSGPSGGFVPAKVRPPRPLAELLSDAALERLRERSPHVIDRLRQFRDTCGALQEIPVTELVLDKQLFMAMRLDLGAGIVVYGSDADMQEQAGDCLGFFKDSSCGKCVPCRLGCMQLVQLADQLRRPSPGVTREAVEETAKVLRATMEAASICGLGRTAAKPLATLFPFLPPLAQPTPGGAP